MTKIQSATGITQLAKIDRVVALRLERFQSMQQALADVDELILPSGIEPGHACHLYVLRVKTDRIGATREAFVKHLKEEWGVACGHHYPAVWSWEAFEKIPCDKGDTPVTQEVVDQVVSLPVFPLTTDDEIQYIADAVKGALRALK